jgi:hypothetical protein
MPERTRLNAGRIQTDSLPSANLQIGIVTLRVVFIVAFVTPRFRVAAFWGYLNHLTAVLSLMLKHPKYPGGCNEKYECPY